MSVAFYVIHGLPLTRWHTYWSQTHALETSTINRFHILAPVFGAVFYYHMRRLEGKNSGAENKHG